MVCNVCAHDEFTPQEYRSEIGSVPALECTRCKAFNFAEEAATTAAERASVKLVIALRTGFADPGSPPSSPFAHRPMRSRPLSLESWR